MNKFIKQLHRLIIITFLILTVIPWCCAPKESGAVLDVEETYGLVNVSVCNLRPSPAHNTELISQALMGTPLKILKMQSGWYFVQTPESYEGWVDSQAIHEMTLAEFEDWKKSDRIIYTEKYGDITGDTTSMHIISDIVAGALIRVEGVGTGYYRVVLPDDSKGYIPSNDAALFDEWLSVTIPAEENLGRCARLFTGIPYLWGGTSSKAFDCSGFIKTVYYLNGIILARDASQQFMYGIKISKEAYPDSLRVGDLMFFGHYKDGKPRPTHVGMYIGDTEFIHASGRVKVNSLDSTRSNFSRSRRDAFLGVRRIIGAEPGEGLQPVSTHPWYD